MLLGLLVGIVDAAEAHGDLLDVGQATFACSHSRASARPTTL
ncbi:hypothetical protein GGQ61_000365 [Phenylobacterium haematophilum]|uniref:Uncharacterized protein n=1 Tax=Phenylobacterium haematophilum TaxID=98513 RepID=A0A839ZUH3_9CAUL|nr:hypothetical protein [Phenylobacterium haematophilum]MBB3889668.1 hypothetical protein [Phenylobacterium haematophilum]